MSIRTVNFRDDVLFPVCDLLGIDPLQDLLRDHARAMGSAINAKTRQAWELTDWPELNLTEERAFRQVWNSSQQYNRQPPAGSPDELYYLPNQTYYQVNATAPSDPPIGTLPTDPTYFAVLDPVSHYIAFDQPGRQSIGEIEGIYGSDPGVSDTYVPGRPYTLSERGIEVGWAGATTVWIRYQVRPSKFSTQLYDAATAYTAGAVVYWTDGQCYRAIVATTGRAPTDTGYWSLVPMPYCLSEIVKYGAAAQVAEDPALKAEYAGEAETALGRELDKLTAQGKPLGRYQIGGGQRRRIPYGIVAWSNSIPA